jgi:hypothetical protein
MEIAEHLDETRHFFVTAPIWANIRCDDPRIQNHPLKDKAKRITVARPQAAASTKAVPASVRVKPKSKPATKRTKSAHESQESKGNDTGLSREKSPQAYTSSQKGKGREVVPGENEDDAVEVKRGRATRVQKRKGSNTTSPPIAVGTTKQVADSTSKPVSNWFS